MRAPKKIIPPPILSHAQLIEMYGAHRADEIAARRARVAAQFTDEIKASLDRPMEEVATIVCVRPDLVPAPILKRRRR